MCRLSTNGPGPLNITFGSDMPKVSNIAVVLRWYKQQYENEGKKQCCESENNSFASTYILNEKFEQQKLSQLRGAMV